MSYQVLARKWRPRSFPEMVGQEHVLRALINALDNDRLHHAFLFTGTRGVGKTTVARILAKSINCEQGMSSHPCGQCSACREIDAGRFVDLIEVDAASRTKVEDTRELLENVQYAPSRGRYKVYLIDEVHMLSNHSFNALLKTLEEPPPHVKFLLATTDPQKLPVTILSRCLQFNLKRLPLELIQGHLTRILGEEGIDSEPAALQEIAIAADGSMRDALSLLDQAIAYGGGRVAAREVRDMLGSIDRERVFALVETLADGDARRLLESCRALAEHAPDFANVLADLISLLHRVALAQALPEAVDDTLGDADKVRALATRLAPEDVQLFYQIGITGRRDLPLAPDPRTGFEMVMLRMLAFRPAEEPGAPPPGSGGQGPQRMAPERSVRPETPPAPVRAEPVTPSSGWLPPAEPVPADKVAESPPSFTPAPVSQPTSVDSAPMPIAQPVSADGEDWTGLVNRLPLAGVTRQLALQSALLRREGDRFELGLDPAHAHLRSEKREESLRQTLEELIGRPVRLTIQVGATGGVTPAMVQERASAELQQEAERAIADDSVVQNLLERFDGHIVPGSVRPLGDGTRAPG